MRLPPADFHICPSCGTEFGYDDAGRTHTELRAVWLRGGAHWWSPVDRAPAGWDPYMQISNIAELRSIWEIPYSVLQAAVDLRQIAPPHVYPSVQSAAPRESIVTERKPTLTGPDLRQGQTPQEIAAAA